MNKDVHSQRAASVAKFYKDLNKGRLCLSVTSFTNTLKFIKITLPYVAFSAESSAFGNMVKHNFSCFI